MATKAKDVYTPRFDFGSNLDLDGTQTGTIGELLKEINRGYGPKNGELADFDSLQRTLGFIHQITGEKISKPTDPIALSTLKTIKLLFLTNHKSKRHLIGLIEPPSSENLPTMEFCTGTTIPRDKGGSELIRSMTEALALEISPEKLGVLAKLIGHTENSSFSEGLNHHVEQINDSVFRLFSCRMIADSRGQANAYYELSKRMHSMRYRRTGESPIPVHESIYCHLQSLGFQHFILHHRTFIKDIRVNDRINPISEQAIQLCHALGELKEAPIHPEDKIASVNDFPKLVAVYHKEFNSLVKKATGLVTVKKRLIENVKIAQAILISYGYRCYDESDPNAKLLSVLDIVAALCSVRYQQYVRTEYDPLWPGRKSQGTSPQRLFEKGLRKNDPHQHQGVFQIYFYRFSEYLAMFSNANESYNGWMAYQISRLDAYTRILQLNYINGIVASSLHFDEVCMQEAMNIADTYTTSAM